MMLLRLFFITVCLSVGALEILSLWNTHTHTHILTTFPIYPVYVHHSLALTSVWRKLITSPTAIIKTHCKPLLQLHCLLRGKKYKCKYVLPLVSFWLQYRQTHRVAPRLHRENPWARFYPQTSLLRQWAPMRLLIRLVCLSNELMAIKLLKSLTL